MPQPTDPARAGLGPMMLAALDVADAALLYVAVVDTDAQPTAPLRARHAGTPAATALAANYALDRALMAAVAAGCPAHLGSLSDDAAEYAEQATRDALAAGGDVDRLALAARLVRSSWVLGGVGMDDARAEAAWDALHLVPELDAAARERAFLRLVTSGALTDDDTVERFDPAGSTRRAGGAR